MTVSFLGACDPVTPRQSEVTSKSPDVTYVGSDTCASCHQAETAKWQNSHHNLAMREATRENGVGDFANRTLETPNGTSTFSETVAGVLNITTSLGDDHPTTYPVKYTFGVHPLQQYLLDTGNGRLQSFTLAWDARHKNQGGQRWFDLRPGETNSISDTLHWGGRAYNWNVMCADCHSTAVRKNYTVDTDTYSTTFAEISVGCEACHGPGSAHVANASSKNRTFGGLPDDFPDDFPGDFPDDFPGDFPDDFPDIRSQEGQINACAPCHSRRSQFASGFNPGRSFFDHYSPALLDDGLYHTDGQIREEVYVYGSFLQSKMHQAGVRCSECHDPHSAALRRTGNAVCTSCHQLSLRVDFPLAGGKDYESVEHHFHAESSAGAQCVNCHMPATVYMGIDPRRDHSFRIPRPDLSTALNVPNACNQCHKEQTAQWAAEQIRMHHGNDRPIHFAPVFDAANRSLLTAEPQLANLVVDTTVPIMVRATAAARLGGYHRGYTIDALKRGLADADPLVRLGSLRGLASLTENSRWRLGNSLLSDRHHAVRLEAFRTLLGSASVPNHRARLRPFLDDYLQLTAFSEDTPEAHTSIAMAHTAFGNLIDAESAFEKALTIEPQWVPAMVNLADLYRVSGRDRAGQELLERAAAIVPQDGGVHYALGLWLVRNGDSEDALTEFSRAHQLAPEQPGYGYALALSLDGAGRTQQALDLLRKSHTRWPQNSDFLFALATMSRDLELIGDAQDYVKQLQQIDPGNVTYRAFAEDLEKLDRVRH